MKNAYSAQFNSSVIIPVYNAEPFLAAAIESVLNQTVPPHQVIVIDDGSTDQSARIAQRYLPYIQLAQQPNAGCAHARNRGVALATGELLAFLDADDYWAPEKLALQIDLLQQSPQIEAVFGQLKQTYAGPSTGLEHALASTDVADGYNLDTLLIRRQAFARIGAFDPALPLINAVEWLWRARNLGLCTQMLPQVLAWRRIHGNNMSVRERPQVHIEYLRLIKKMTKQKRELVCT